MKLTPITRSNEGAQVIDQVVETVHRVAPLIRADGGDTAGGPQVRCRPLSREVWRSRDLHPAQSSGDLLGRPSFRGERVTAVSWARFRQGRTVEVEVLEDKTLLQDPDFGRLLQKVTRWSHFLLAIRIRSGMFSLDGATPRFLPSAVEPQCPLDASLRSPHDARPHRSSAKCAPRLPPPEPGRRRRSRGLWGSTAAVTNLRFPRRRFFFASRGVRNPSPTIYD